MQVIQPALFFIFSDGFVDLIRTLILSVSPTFLNLDIQEKIIAPTTENYIYQHISK